MRARILAAAALTALVALDGCGYALVGRGVVVDPTIKKIGVPTFANATGKAALDQKITQRVIEELLRRGRFDVVQERSGVDALVEGEILRYDAQPVGFSAGTAGVNPDAPAPTTTTQASRYAITVTAKIRYGKVGATEPIWSNDAFQFRDEYEVGSDPASFFDREEQAIDRLATSFARSLVAAMLEAF